ncbi:hypothetical protein B0H17DRAFT_1146820 [Mycena rosella]|uniref:Uncharacterized protein n=1 Tax=Mycena rosella TaxID=1033263 RepID=A0AAD7CNR2_MYCRO|nr:hypothetical protein B0H17DRAFT_1146820 [Mycena rosella]
MATEFILQFIWGALTEHVLDTGRSTSTSTSRDLPWNNSESRYRRMRVAPRHGALTARGIRAPPDHGEHAEWTEMRVSRTHRDSAGPTGRGAQIISFELRHALWLSVRCLPPSPFFSFFLPVESWIGPPASRTDVYLLACRAHLYAFSVVYDELMRCGSRRRTRAPASDVLRIVQMYVTGRADSSGRGRRQAARELQDTHTDELRPRACDREYLRRGRVQCARMCNRRPLWVGVYAWCGGVDGLRPFSAPREAPGGSEKGTGALLLASGGDACTCAPCGHAAHAWIHTRVRLLYAFRASRMPSFVGGAASGCSYADGVDVLQRPRLCGWNPSAMDGPHPLWIYISRIYGMQLILRPESRDSEFGLDRLGFPSASDTRSAGVPLGTEVDWPKDRLDLLSVARKFAGIPQSFLFTRIQQLNKGNLNKPAVARKCAGTRSPTNPLHPPDVSSEIFLPWAADVRRSPQACVPSSRFVASRFKLKAIRLHPGYQGSDVRPYLKQGILSFVGIIASNARF